MDPLTEAKTGLMRAHTADRMKTGATDPMDYVALGYLTPDGQATPFGDEFVAMVQGGLMETDGTPTTEGEAYRLNHRDSLEAPLEIYRKREELGLNKAEKDSTPDDGGFFGVVEKFASQSVPRVAETFWNTYAAPLIEIATIVPRKITEAVTGEEVNLPRTAQTFDEKINSISENLTGGVLASEGLASGAIYHGDLAQADPGTYMQGMADKVPGVSALVRAVYGDETINENIRMKSDEAFAAKQRWELHNAEIAELKGADMMEMLTGIDQWQQSREALVAQQGEAAVKANDDTDRLAGNFLLDPGNVASVGIGKLVGGAVASASRVALGAEKLALRSKVLQMSHAAAVAERATLEAGATRSAAIAKSATERGAALRTVGNEAQAVRYENLAAKLEERASGLVTRVDELATTEAKLADEIGKIGAKAGVAEAIVRTTERARAIRQLPAQAFGEISERIGTGLVKTDAFLAEAAEKIGVTGVYNSIHSLPMRMGTMASSAVLGPVAAGTAIASQIMASGPFLQSVGNFSKVLGRELIQERGSVPFWRRVANNSTITKTQRFLSHRMDEATLGGMVTDVARPVVKGTAHAYPMNLAFEVLQNPDQDAAKMAENAFGASLVFGGGAAGAGAIFKGSKQRLKEIRVADELNFTRNLDDSNKAEFNGVSRGARRVVSTYAAAFPNLNWDFSHSGQSHYDPTTNTARINPTGGNPLRALIGHEVLHYVTIRNQMEPVIHSMLLGDSETPGLLRNTDGTLNPEFEKFKAAYDARMDSAALERVSLQKIAEEYFNEATVDHLLEMTDSGDLSRMAGRTQAGRHLRAFIAATIPRSVILKDFFFRSGGVMEAGGRRVTGNGLLAEGIRELPEAKAMMRNMVKKSAGETVFQQASDKGDRTGIPLAIQKGDPIIDSFHAILESDANGKPIRDKDGNHIAISRATDEARSSAGHVITEAQTKRVQAGHLPAEGEMKANDNGAWSGEYMDRAFIDALAAKGILNAKQIAILRNISTATKGGQGFRFLITNHPATVKGRGGRVKYATLGATLRETVPVGFGITKDGNILVHLMSVHQLDANIQTRAASKRGRNLYNGNTEVIKQDVAAMMDLHRTNTKTDKFYQDKYGAKWQEHQQFINTVFGMMTKEQTSVNPMFNQDNVNSPKDHVYRTYRLDRISKATKMDGTPMPFGYERVKANFLPDGVIEPSN